MITTIALRDPDTRILYEQRADASPPVTMEAALTMLKSILRGRARDIEIDQFSTGAPHTALVTTPDLAATPEAPAAAIDFAALVAQLTAKIDKIGTKKPKVKGKGGKAPEDPDKDKITIPRNADGSVKEWIEGMQPCKYCNGKHLHRDCTSEAAKKAKEESGK